MPVSAKKDTGKKKKRSKKEIEAERLALEEQRRKEEEAARLAELARVREREIADQREREELDAFLESEDPLLAIEREQANELRNICTQQVISLQVNADEKNEWDHFLSCSRIPNPLKEAEVASFFDAFQKEPEYLSFKVMENDLSAAEELHNQLEKYLARSVDHQQINALRYFENIINLRKILDRKWDALSAFVLENTELFPRESTENLLVPHRFSSIDFCVWANYTKNPRHKAFNVFDSIHVTLPKSITLYNVAIRIIHDRSNSKIREFSLQHESGNGVRYSIVDGVISFSLLELPDLPKLVDFWTVKPLISNNSSVRHVPFPFLREDTSEVDKTDVEGSETDIGQNIPVGNDEDGLLVTFSVGPELFINSSATVMWWDSDSRLWRSEGISEVEINRKKGIVQFKSCVFRTCALVQDAYGEFPLVDWHIIPSPITIEGNVKPLLQVIVRGKQTCLELEITEMGVALVRPNSGRLGEIIGKYWSSPSQLFMALTRYGLSFSSPHTMATVSQIRATAINDECHWSMATKCNLIGFHCNLSAPKQTGKCIYIFDAELYRDHINEEMSEDRQVPNNQAPSMDSSPLGMFESRPDGIKHLLIVDYDHTMNMKSRVLFYHAHPEGINAKWDPKRKPHGSLLALLNELGPSPLPDYSFIMTVVQTLRLLCPLSN